MRRPQGRPSLRRREIADRSSCRADTQSRYRNTIDKLRGLQSLVEDVWYCYSERSTVKARNLRRDPRVVVHLESGADVVIVHGHLRDLGAPADHPEIVEAFDQKYTQPVETPFLPSSDPAFDVLYSLEPRRALLWSLPDTEASTRRWSGNQGQDDQQRDGGAWA